MRSTLIMPSNMASLIHTFSAAWRQRHAQVKSLLLLVLLLVGSSAQAEFYKFQLNVTMDGPFNLNPNETMDLSNFADITGGTAEIVNPQNSTSNIIDTKSSIYHITLRGTYVHIHLNSALQAGEVISFESYNQNCDLYITNSNETSTSNIVLAASTNAGKDANNITYYSGSYTVADNDGIQGKTDIYLWNKARAYIRNFSIQGLSYNYTLNAVDGNNNVLKTIATGEVGDQNVTVYYPIIIEKDGKFYKCSDTRDYSVTFDAADGSDTTVKTVTYTENSNIVAYIEGEDAANYNNGVSDAAYSNGSTGHVKPDSPTQVATSLGPGEYTYYAYLTANGGRSLDLRNGNNNDNLSNWVTSLGISSNSTAGLYNNTFTIHNTMPIKLSGWTHTNDGTTNQSADFDYMYIVKNNSSVTTLTGISVKSKTTIGKSKTETLTVTYTPSVTTTPIVRWYSSDPSVASVNAETGVVTGVEYGDAIITAYVDGGAFTATCNVKVSDSKTKDDLTTITTDWRYEPSQALTDGVLYDSGRLLSIGGNSLNSGGGVKVKGKGTALALKVKNAPALIKVTFKNYNNDNARRPYIDNVLPSDDSSYPSNPMGTCDAFTGTTTIEARSNAEQVLYIFSAKDNDLFVTNIQVIYNTYTVTYNVSNGSLASDAANEATESTPGGGVALPSVTPNTGYSFLGWATNANATEPDAGQDGATYHPTENITLYALCVQQNGVQSLVINDHNLVADNGTYSYTIGNAYTSTTIPVTITPAMSTATVTAGSTTGTAGQAVTVNATIGTTLSFSVTNDNLTANYNVLVSRAADISVSGDSYAIANQDYYEGQRIVGTNITASISTTAGGDDHNSAGSTYGVLTGKNLSSSYSGDITYSNQLWNSRGNNAVWDANYTPTSGAYYTFTPSVSGTLEVAVNLGANKTLYVSDGTKQLTYGTDYNTSVALTNGALTAASNLSIYINVEAEKTYYVYANKTKIGLLGFALNAGWLHVVEDGQEYILSSDNYNAHSYFTKSNAGTTHTYKGVTIYRIKKTDDQISVKVKDATAVRAVISNGGNNRDFTVAVDGTIQGTETANGETTSSYYAINKSGSTVTLAGTGDDLYAYKLIFYRNTPSIIDVSKNSKKLTTDTLYVDDNQTSYTITTNNNTGTVSMNASAVSSFATATLTESNGSYTLNVTPVGGGKTGSGVITLSQDASGDYSAGETQFILAVRKHGLTLTLTHNSNDHYTYNADNSTPQDGSFYAAESHATYTNGSTSTAWTITAKNDKDGNVSGLTGYKYYSDDQSVATIDLTSGKVTMAANPFGTTNIIVLYEGDNNYEAAKAEFPIKVTSGIDVKISKGDKPDLNKKYAALSTNGDTLCTMIAGGYKYNKGEIFGSTDNWGTAGPYDDASKFTCQLDGFINQSQADVDSRNEFNQEIEWYEEYASTDTDHENPPLMRRIKPFTLPVRGAYLKFEPTVNGILTAYVLQNGDITFENDGGDGLPISVGKAPRAYYWFDQNGYRIEPTHYVSKLPLRYGRDYTKNGRQVFFDNDDTDKRHNLTYWYKHNAGLQNLYENSTVNEETGEVTKEAKWPTQAQVNANLARVIPDPQPVVRYANGFSVHQKAYVKYQLNVVAGNTYYFFSNVSKVGFAGFNFKQNDNAVPTAYNEDGAQYNITVTRKTASQAMKQSGNDADVLTTFKPSDANHINQYDQITFNRTFKIGTWNTITLPFSLTETQVEKVFGVGTILVTYNGVAQSGGHNTAFFLRHVDQNILAGQPYFIKPTGVKSKTKDNNNNVVITYIDNVTTGDATPKYVGGNGGLTFKGVNVDFNLAAQNYEQDTYKESGSCAYKDTDLRCVGTLAKTNVATGDYFINVNSGDLVEYTGAGTQMNAYRAFLKQNGTNLVKLTSVNYSGLDGVDWEAEATGIMEVLVNDMGVEIAPVQGVYNLNGQKVGDSTKGLPAGLYIVNGKVINIK